MRVTIVGSGDAFGSGGRFNTCFHVETAGSCFLVDCGASSLIALKRLPLDRRAIRTIIITHFHGDHVGGLPYFVLDAQFFTKRTEPLTVAGPPGLGASVERVMETAFPGSSAARRAFEIELVELPPDAATVVNGIQVRTATVRHGEPATAHLAYRLTADGKVLAYTGDTEWVDALARIGRDADLLIAEAYTYEKRVPLHLDLKTLEGKLPEIAPKRLLLTHMSEDMLCRLDDLAYEAAGDGLVIDL